MKQCIKKAWNINVSERSSTFYLLKIRFQKLCKKYKNINQCSYKIRKKNEIKQNSVHTLFLKVAWQMKLNTKHNLNTGKWQGTIYMGKIENLKNIENITNKCQIKNQENM